MLAWWCVLLSCILLMAFILCGSSREYWGGSRTIEYFKASAVERDHLFLKPISEKFLCLNYINDIKQIQYLKKAIISWVGCHVDVHHYLECSVESEVSDIFHNVDISWLISAFWWKNMLTDITFTFLGKKHILRFNIRYGHWILNWHFD